MDEHYLINKNIMIEWHRLFGLTLIDFFTNSAYKVELEKDLSLKQQYLDLVIIEKKGDIFSSELPDGFDNLSTHNLITYKSLHEPLDSWAIDELIGHYVNYRKQISPSAENLLPVNDFRLYGITTRYPENLKKDTVLNEINEGVYEIQWGVRNIRIIVLSQISTSEKNAIWQLFSGIPEKVQYGASHYDWHQSEIITVINQLYENYQMEGILMSYTVEDFCKEYTKNHIDLLSLDDRLKGLSFDEILKNFSSDEIKAYLKKNEKD